MNALTRMLAFAFAAAMAFGCAAAEGSGAVAQRRIETSDHVQLAVRMAGDGPTCIFVHGGPGQGSRSFEQLGGDALQPFLRMVYLDQRGSGASDNAADYHLDRMVQDIEDVRSALGVPKVCLIAHSFGGILATVYAQRHPEHVSALVMLNAAVHFHSDYNTRMRMEFANRVTGTPAPPLRADISRTELEKLADEALERLVKQGKGYRLLAEDPAVQTRMREVDSSYPRTLDFGTRVLRDKADYPEYYRDYADASAAVTAPVLVLTGDRDFAVGPEQYKRFRFPRATVEHVDAGHLMYYERTGDIVRLIRNFLVEQGVVAKTSKSGGQQ